MAMFSSVSALVAVAVFMAGLANAQISSGYATYSNGGGGVCSSVSSSLPSVSMNAAQFANGAACGQCIQITGSGNGAGSTPVSTAPYVAVINNVCPQCNYGDIDLQESGDGKYGISWTFVGCPGSGRKLIETPFQGDTTVYTGFAHLGLTGKDVLPAPEQAPEQATEQPTEQPADSSIEPEVEAEAIQEEKPTPVESITEPEEVISLTPLEDLETIEKTEAEVVKTSRRLLMN